MEQNCQILNRVIDIIKLIAGQRSAYRGYSKGARDLRDTNKRHGNFLELVVLLCMYDPLLNAHVDNCVEKMKKKKKKARTFGTFIGKTTVNSILVNLGELIKRKLSSVAIQIAGENM